MIEKLKQIEDKMILNLLLNVDEWKTSLINSNKQIIERCNVQVGNYSIYLDFIHKCEKKDVVFNYYLSKSASHIVYGKYEIGVGIDEGDAPSWIEEDKGFKNLFNSLIDNGNSYHIMSEDAYYYIFPINEVCASVTLCEIKDNIDSFEPLSNQKKLIMIKWFEDYYRNRVHILKVSENENIKKGDWVKIDENAMSVIDRRGIENYIGKMGFVIGKEKNFIDVRFGNDRTKIHSKLLVLLDSKDKPVSNDKEDIKTEDARQNEKIDHMQKDLWPDDSEDEI